MKRGTIWILVMSLAGCSQQAQQAAGGIASPPTSAPASSASDSTGLSGIYVSYGHDIAADEVFIEALRITQSGPGQFTGTLESTEINNAGKTTPSTQNVTGTFDGNHATIALDQVIGHVNREATLAPDSITMTWMQNGQLASEKFVRKSDADYASMLQTLSHVATNLVATNDAVAKARQANKETADLVDRLQHFLDKEATWSVAPAEARQKKVAAYGEAGVTKVKQLLTLHNSMADVNANTLTVQMNTAGIQLGLALDADENAAASAQQKIDGFDRAIVSSPCLAPDGTLVPNPLPACAPLPALVSRYRAVHAAAESMLAQLTSISQQTRSDYDARLKVAQQLVNAGH